MSSFEILLISNSTDFTTDYVAFELEKRGANYLRVNRDAFESYKIYLNVLKATLEIEIEGKKYFGDNEGIRSIYYRAPTFLRDNYKPNLTIEEQLYRTQWSAFIRNLAIFDQANWMNNPVATYRAENKFLQLRVAQKVGFECPRTYASNINKAPSELGKEIVVKSIDTALMRTDENEYFAYTNVIKSEELCEYENSIAPFFMQSYINPKVDIRVSVVGNKVYSVAITKNNKGLDGDWRLQKDTLVYKRIELPDNVNKQCVNLVRELSLRFGGIDLAFSEGKYYFIEINPTGEWVWLVNKTGIEVPNAIGDVLCK